MAETPVAPYRATKVFDVPLADGRTGALHISHAPGLQSELTKWHRDLDADMARLASVYGTSLVVSLLPQREADHIGIGHERDAARAASIDFTAFPIPNGAVPPQPDDEFDAFIADLCARVHAGARVLVHCRAGFGRAGLVAACVLLAARRATTGAEAIAALRAKRPSKRTRVVETRLQEAYVDAFVARMGR